MTASDLSRRALLAAAGLAPASRAFAAAAVRRRPMSFAQPKIVCDDIVVTSNQRFAVFKPRLVDAKGEPTVAVSDMDAVWRTVGGWAGDNWGGADYWRASGSLRWRAGEAGPNEGEIAVRLGANTFNAKATRNQAFGINIHLGDGCGAAPGYTDVGAHCTVQAGAEAARPIIWSLPMDQASLDAIRPTSAIRSRFGWGDFEPGETGVDVYNGQIGETKPFVVGPDRRVHLRCVALPRPVRDYKGSAKSIGQARLIAPTRFRRGDLIEMDVQHHVPGWLITWTAGEFDWPRSGEIDFGEYRPDWCAGGGINIVQHYNGAAPSGLGGVAPVTGIDLTRPHVRSIEWTPDDQILVRYNGVEQQRWPMLWNGAEHTVIVQAAAYTALKPTDPMPELSLGGWTHYRPKAA